VLITGESGTGKGLAARAIHEASACREGPFVEANCVVYSEGILHSELFGHERGAFTGALRQKRGRFELAAGGTIFLDEIGEISPATQLMLLRILQDQSFERVGGEQTLRSDARVIAATNADLEAAIEAGKFRRDLYYRLNVIPVHMPSLRERPEDVPILATHFLRRFAESKGSRVESFESEALDRMASYGWPGNVRELQNVVERLVVLSPRPQIAAQDLPAQFRGSDGESHDSAEVSLRRMEQERILDTLRRCGGNKKRAAEILGIHRATLYAKMHRYGIALNPVDDLEEASVAGSER
jgi:two-component system response regulator HydG